MKRLVALGHPGSGKTTWIMKTMEGVIEAQVFPEQICMVTFTAVVAREIGTRLQPGFPHHRYHYLVWMGTVQSICRSLFALRSDVICWDFFGCSDDHRDRLSVLGGAEDWRRNPEWKHHEYQGG